MTPDPAVAIMNDYVTFEIARCVNPSACQQRPLLVTVNGDTTRLTGSCGGPYVTTKTYRVRRSELLAALAPQEREGEG